MEDFEKIENNEAETAEIPENEEVTAVSEDTAEDFAVTENSEDENTVSEDTTEENAVTDSADDLNAVFGGEEDTVSPEFDFKTENEETADISENAKKGKFNKSLIIATIVVLAAALAGAAYFLISNVFFDNSIAGTWVLDQKTSTADEKSTTKSEDDMVYFNFNKDQTADLSMGTVKIKGTWSYPKKGADKKVNIDISGYFSGSYEYKVEGNMFSGKKMTIKTQGDPIKFKSATPVTPELKVSDKFKPSSDVTGKWKYEESGNKIIYTFNNDGTFTYSMETQIYGNREYYGVYTVDTKKKNINATYIQDKKIDAPIPYQKGKADELIIGGVTLKKVK